MDAFIGRDHETQELTKLFDQGHRLVTLTGPSGIGKSRLAEEWANDDAIFVDLTEARTREDIEQEVSEALRTDDSETAAPTGGQALVEFIVDQLNQRSDCLVVLDSFEHVTEHAADTVDTWLQRCPKVRVLITSQTRLRLREEAVMELLPLAVPPPNTKDRSPAIDLLVERARQIHRNYEVPALEVLGEIVRQLDGLPLALELAAPRLVMLGPEVLLTKLRERFAAMGGKALGAAVESSWELLGPAERQLLAQCSVFRGGFDLQAAEAIVQLEQGELVLDALQTLHDHSLVRANQRGRFRLYSAIREFAAAQLSDEERKAVIERHAEYFATLGKRLREDLDSDQGDRNWRTLRAERNNLRAAADRTQQPRVAAEATLSLGPLMLTSEAAVSDEERLTRSLKKCPELAAELHLQRGFIRYQTGRVDEAERDLKLAAHGAVKVGRRDVEVRALRTLAHATLHQGNPAAAFELVSEALPKARDSCGSLEVARTLVASGMIQSHLGRLSEAEEAFEEALHTFQRDHALRDEALTQGMLGLLFLNTRRAGEAQLVLAEAEAIQERIGAAFDATFTSSLRAKALLVRGDYQAAIAAYQELEERQARLGALRFQGDTRGNLGLAILLSGGDLAEAERVLVEGQELCRSSSELEGEVLFGALAAGVAARNDSMLTAENRLKNVEEKLDTAGPLTQLAVKLQRAHLDPARREELIEHVQKRGDDGRAPADKNANVLLSLRTLLSANRPPAAAARHKSVVFDRNSGRVFVPGAQQPIDLSTRAVLQRVLFALLEAKLSGQGTLTRDQVADAGWPGEQIAPKTRVNRVHVAIATLRKLGFQDVIASSRGAYSIHPAMEVEEGEISE